MPGFTTRPEIRGTFGVVATTHWLASSVAMGVLEKGGNAFDAAGAGGVSPHAVRPRFERTPRAATAAPVAGGVCRRRAGAGPERGVVAEGGAGAGDRGPEIGHAPDAWFRGFAAEESPRFCQGARGLGPPGGRHNGLLTADDMAR